jgi:hypothetical protein
MEAGIVMAAGGTEEADKGSSRYDLLIKESGRFGWFTKGAQVMGIGMKSVMKRRWPHLYTYLLITCACSGRLRNPSPEHFLEAGGWHTPALPR